MRRVAFPWRPRVHIVAFHVTARLLKASAGASGPIADPLAYLYRTANNLMLDRKRAELRQAKRDHEWSGAADGVGEPASDAPSDERVLIARAELEAAEQALEALGERTSTVFRRFRVEGRTQRQIADELGISLSAVEKDLQRAYRAIAAGPTPNSLPVRFLYVSDEETGSRTSRAPATKNMRTKSARLSRTRAMRVRATSAPVWSPWA